MEQQPPVDRVSVKTRHVAHALGVHPATVLKMVRAGTFETVAVGKRKQITLDSFRRVVGLTQPATAPAVD
jgi:hypothetical protein